MKHTTQQHITTSHSRRAVPLGTGSLGTDALF